MQKKTPLYNQHIKNRAKMIDFYGWCLPLEYEGTLKEHTWVREKSGLFDTSHMGRIFVSGKDGSDFLQYICTNNIDKIDFGCMLYTTACNRDGRILDDFMVYKFKHGYICVVNASNRKKMYDWLLSNKKKFDIKIEDKSDIIGMLAFQGPLASDIVSSFIDISDIFYLQTKKAKTEFGDLIISMSGYTGEDGFEIMVENDYIVKLWDYLLGSYKDRVFPCGLAVRDILRLEMGYSLYGADISEKENPLEANLGWVVNLNKENFIGKECLLTKKNAGVFRKLIGFRILEKGFPRSGYKIFKRGMQIGKVTSGGYSPALNKFIGLGYVGKDFSKPGIEIEIKIRDNFHKAKVVDIPFIEPKVIRRSNEAYTN